MYEIFLLFFSDAMITLLVDQTNLYATRDKNMANFGVDHAEMRKFLGLLLISEYQVFLEKKTTGAQLKTWKPLYSQKQCLGIAFVL